MNLQGRKKSEVQIDLTALIDVVFILLIFIVLAASFQRSRALLVEVPVAKGQAAGRDKVLSVVVPERGKLVVQGQAIEASELVKVLLESGSKATMVEFQMDARGPVGRAVRVLGEVRAAGFERVSIVTREPAS